MGVAPEGHPDGGPAAVPLRHAVHGLAPRRHAAQVVVALDPHARRFAAATGGGGMDDKQEFDAAKAMEDERARLDSNRAFEQTKKRYRGPVRTGQQTPDA